MGMSIEQAQAMLKAYLHGSTGYTGSLRDAIDTVLPIVEKYQKIEQIMDELNGMAQALDIIEQTLRELDGNEKYGYITRITKVTTREEAVSILRSILADLQRTAKDTDNVACCSKYGFITYGKAKECINVLEQDSDKEKKQMTTKVTIDGKEYCVETLLHEVKRLKRELTMQAEDNRQFKIGMLMGIKSEIGEREAALYEQVDEKDAFGFKSCMAMTDHILQEKINALKPRNKKNEYAIDTSSGFDGYCPVCRSSVLSGVNPTICWKCNSKLEWDKEKSDWDEAKSYNTLKGENNVDTNTK